MTKKHIEQTISILKQRTRSTDTQMTISHWLLSNDYGPASGGVKRSAIEDKVGDSLTHTVVTSLSHLEDIGFVEEYLERDVTYVIAEWHPDVFVMGKVDKVAAEGIEVLIDDLEPPESRSGETKIATDGSGVSLRKVIADTFDLHVEEVEPHLRRGDPVNRLNNAVEAIEENEYHEVGNNYGKIVFRNPAYRYRLTETAKQLYELRK
ncbi:MAG: hypothetical protein U9O06_14770 [Euryarchaeota archaeon]|nr:hypothetical protein [Euryarchaeota archaeon]